MRDFLKDVDFSWYILGQVFFIHLGFIDNLDGDLMDESGLTKIYYKQSAQEFSPFGVQMETMQLSLWHKLHVPMFSPRCIPELEHREPILRNTLGTFSGVVILKCGKPYSFVRSYQVYFILNRFFQLSQ